MYHSFHTNITFIDITFFDIDNNKKCFWAPNQYIRMIYEGSCDTEDWNNVNYIKIQLYLHRNKLHF